MVKWKLTPQQLLARKKAEEAAQAQRSAARAHLAAQGQSVDDERDVRVGTGAASRSALSKSQDNTVDITRQRRARELQEKLAAAHARLKDASKLLSAAKTQQLLGKASSAAFADPAKAPPKWEAVKDKATGKVYWWDRRSNDTSWVNPSLGGTATAASAAAAKVAAAKVAAIAPGRKKAKRTQPPGPSDFWLVVQTPEQDDYYFWNASTDKVSWTQPDDFPSSKEEQARLKAAEDFVKGLVQWREKLKAEEEGRSAAAPPPPPPLPPPSKRKSRWDLQGTGSGSAVAAGGVDDKRPRLSDAPSAAISGR